MLCACIDNVNMMAYDQFDERGDHSPIFEMGADATKHFLRLGFSKEQLCLGIPFYGRTADGYAMVRDKTALALRYDLGGIMIFSSTADITYDSEYVLHRAVTEVLDQRVKYRPLPDRTIMPLHSGAIGL